MRIFSGIQPTGAKHLGNYSGGFRQYVATQEEGDAFFCIVDLHSISVEHDPAELHDSTLDLAAMLFANGLDADRSTVFVQSHVTAHAEANWLLGAVASYGQLGRMTQFKDKAERREFVSAALFTYPVLMAGDILLDQEAKPGISNLIEIMSVATGDSFDAIEARYDGQGYGPFKADVAEAVVALLDPIRGRYEAIRADEPELRRLLAHGADKARSASAPTLAAMYERMGFVTP